MMDKTKTCSDSSNPNTNNNTNNSSNRNQTDVLLKQLNKSSHKISKPSNHLNRQISQSSSSQHSNNLNHVSSNINNQQQQQQQQQPPVYNINKNDFRDVVQKLTGSPAHDRLSTPPPIHPPKPPSSRLQRIRPPPLAHVSNRPPPPPVADAGSGAVTYPRSPFSPLPPFPTVSAAAESPISAYMRYLQNSITASAAAGDPDLRRLGGNPTSLPPVPIPSPQSAMNSFSAAASQLMLPGSPLAFGHMPSPRLQYPLLSPSFLFSPTSQLGFPALPVSPRLTVPSPMWKDV